MNLEKSKQDPGQLLRPVISILDFIEFPHCGKNKLLYYNIYFSLQPSLMMNFALGNKLSQHFKKEDNILVSIEKRYERI